MKDADTTHENCPPNGGSGRNVEDFLPYCEGDIEPSLHKKIEVLIDCDTDYIVYLDDEYFVEWSWTDSYGETPDSFGEIASSVALLETLSTALLSSKRVGPFRRLLGEAIARILGDKDADKARQTVETARMYLQARALETARTWYLVTACLIVCIALVTALVIWLLRARIARLTGADAFEVGLGCIAGALGAFISILIRLARPDGIKVDAGAGAAIHCLECAARIAAGMAGALLSALAIKADLFLGFAKSADHHLAFLLMTCIVAGASERFVPGLIKRVETSAIGQSVGG
jgi:hypothetical protein